MSPFQKGFFDELAKIAQEFQPMTMQQMQQMYRPAMPPPPPDTVKGGVKLKKVVGTAAKLGKTGLTMLDKFTRPSMISHRTPATLPRTLL